MGIHQPPTPPDRRLPPILAVLKSDRYNQTRNEALKVTGLTLEGTHHRGIDDARNIARLAAFVLPQIAAEE
jgi:inhibitor of KinA sporulation pathway (predicted exonuclease)